MSVALVHAIRGLLALLLLTPLVISPGTFAHFAASKAIYARILIETMFVAWVFLALKFPEFRPPQSRVLLALTLYALAALLAALWGINPTQSLWSSYDRMTGVVDLVHWLLFAVVLVSVMRRPGDWTVLLNWQLGVTTLLAIIGLTQAYGYSFIPSVAARCRVDATLGNPSLLAPILVVSILVAAGLFLQSVLKGGPGPDPQWAGPGRNTAGLNRGPVPLSLTALRGFWLTVIFLGIFVLILTGTRGALIGLAAGAACMPIAMLIWGNRQAVKGTALAAGGVLATVAILFAADHTVGLSTTDCADQTASNRLADLASAGTGDSSLENRLAAIEAGLQGFIERPLLGWGPENFGYAFDRHVDAWVFKHGSFVQDKAHNQAIEELATKGVVGALAFLFLWLVLVWAIVRRKRPASEDVLAYAILGALAGYFVQNLFLFDTPTGLLTWLVLAGWAAAQERQEASASLGPDGSVLSKLAGMALHHIQRAVQTILSPAWSRRAAAIALVGLLGISLYSFNLRPYLAARTFGQTSQPGLTIAERLVLAEQSFETFPAMANHPRQLMILQFVRLWGFLDAGERRQVQEFFGREAGAALNRDARYAPLLITAILFMQTTAQSPEALASLGPMLQQLQAVAPQRAETHQLLANQALKDGRYAEALRISREYQALAPGTEPFFAAIRRDAQEGLARGMD